MVGEVDPNSTPKVHEQEHEHDPEAPGHGSMHDPDSISYRTTLV